MSSLPPKNCPQVFIDIVSKAEKEFLSGKELPTIFYIGWESSKNLLKIELDMLIRSNARAHEYLKLPTPSHKQLVEDTIKAIPGIIKDQKADFIINIGMGLASKQGDMLIRKKEVIIAKYESYSHGAFIYLAETKKVLRRKLVNKNWIADKTVFGRMSHLLPLRAMS